jgi:hypothetical protein
MRRLHFVKIDALLLSFKILRQESLRITKTQIDPKDQAHVSRATRDPPQTHAPFYSTFAAHKKWFAARLFGS